MDIEQLAPYPLVLKDPSNMARHAIELAARMLELKLNVVVEVENQVVLRHLVERSMGFGVLPGSALVDDVHRFRTIHLKGVSRARRCVYRELHQFKGPSSAPITSQDARRALPVR